MKFKNYIELNQTGTINGIKVQCLPVNEADAEEWVDLEYGVCEYYQCPFNMTPCLVPCTESERDDKTYVYFKKVE